MTDRPTDAVPFARLAEDFGLKTPEQALDFIARVGLPRHGLVLEADGTVTLPRATYSLFARGCEASGEHRARSPEPA